MVVGIAPSITFPIIGKTVLPYPELYKGAKINFNIEVKKYKGILLKLEGYYNHMHYVINIS